jgi:hypothetical protein
VKNTSSKDSHQRCDVSQRYQTENLPKNTIDGMNVYFNTYRNGSEGLKDD